jgi:hypothetical protein
MKQLQWLAGMAAMVSVVLTGCDQGTAGMDDKVAAEAPAAAAAEANAAEANEAQEAAAPTAVENAVDKVAEKVVTDQAAADKPMNDAGALCELTGAAGSTVTCAVSLAADADGVAARALQGTLTYDGSKAALKGFTTQVCPAEGECVTKAITDTSANIASGHVLKSTPLGKADVAGRLSFMLVNMSAPQTAISEAKVGNAEAIFNAEFVLSEEVRADAPIKVMLGNVVASDEAAARVAARVENATIVTSGIVK